MRLTTRFILERIEHAERYRNVHDGLHFTHGEAPGILARLTSLVSIEP
jgi:hypothetical protein